jgi:aminopeptidase
MKDTRLVELAQLLVNYSIKLQKGEKVLVILYGMEGYPLLKEVYRECVRVGAHCTYELRDSELVRLFFENATQEQIENPPSKARLMQAKEVDAMIQILADRNSSELANVDQQKMIAQRKVNKVVSDILHKKRWVLFEYPTVVAASNAKQSTEQWEDFVFQACLVDWKKVGEEQQALKELLTLAKEVHIVANKTDLRVNIENQSWIKCNGIHNMPDGEIFTSPHRTGVNGNIHFNTPTQYMGKDFQWISLEFKKGQVIGFDSDNKEELKKILNTDTGARYLGEFAFGTNKMIQTPVNSILFDEKIGGSNHMALGKCYDEAPNGNDSSIHWDLIIRHKDIQGKVYLDGELIQENGIWVHPKLLQYN